MTTTGQMTETLMQTALAWHRRKISERTREALAERREAGVQLGRPRIMDQRAVERAVQLRDQGLCVLRIAETMTKEGIPTPMGRGKWWSDGVKRALRYADHQ